MCDLGSTGEQLFRESTSSVATYQHIGLVSFAENGRVSGLTKDKLMIFGSYNQKKTAFYWTKDFCLESTSHGAVYIKITQPVEAQCLYEPEKRMKKG
jgi:hypothetical protein